MPTSEQIKQQLAHLDAMTRTLTLLEVAELPKILQSDEIVYNLLRGHYKDHFGALVATDKRLLFVEKGLVRLRVEDFPYDKISSIQYNTGLVYGSIVIYASGNKSEIEKIPKDKARSFAEGVRTMINNLSKPTTQPLQQQYYAPQPYYVPQEAPVQQPAPVDKFAQIEKLAQLKAQGILTEDEFNVEKRKLLNN